MFKVKVINNEEVKKILKMDEVIQEIEKVYTMKSRGKSCLFPMVFHEFERGVADMDIKSGYMEDIDTFGLKLVSWFGENAQKGLPQLIGTTMVFDSKTGQPKGILNGEHITAMRTGAAAGIGAKYLARKESENLLMVGMGHISIYAVAAVLETMENIKVLKLHDPMCKDNKAELSDKFKLRMSEAFPEMREKIEGISISYGEDLKATVNQSDIIITATPSRAPIIKKEWVKAGTHFSCIGSDMEGKQEIDEKIFTHACVLVDDINQAISVGECEIPIKKGAIKAQEVKGEIGDVITGKVKGRESIDEITIFDSTGIAHQDIITAKLVIDRAEELGLGTDVML